MKVLKQGNGQKEWSVECTCTGNGNGGGGCGALLLVGLSDVYATYRGDYLGDRNEFRTFTCIQCKVETDLPFKSWPKKPVPDKKFHPVYGSSVDGY